MTILYLVLLALLLNFYAGVLSPCVMLSRFGLLSSTGETVTIVGDQDPAMMKYFDCTRSGPRSPFDSNVVYQFEIMEYVRILYPFIQ